MKDYSLNEIKENVKTIYGKGLQNYGNSVVEAATYCFYTYEGMDENSTEYILYVLMIGINIAKNGSKIFIGQLNLINNVLDKIIHHKVSLDINSQELSEVMQMAEQLQQRLSGLDIIYDPLER